MAQVDNDLLSAAIFCPQNRPPEAGYLSRLRHYLLSNPILIPFHQAILDLPQTWALYARTNTHIRQMESGPNCVGYFRDWIIDGKATPLIETISGIISLPLLTIIQVVQYFQYLEARKISHQEFLHEIRHGGAQGFCGGLLPAMAIAAAKTEEEVVHHAAISLRLALGIGAYAEIGDDENDLRPTTVVLRLKDEGQADELVSKFPGLYISAVSDPFNISVTGSPQRLCDLKTHAESCGVPVTLIYLRGKVHNPENTELSAEMRSLCDRVPELQLPGSAALQVPMRSNRTGEVIPAGVSLSNEIVHALLACRCEWYILLNAMATALQETGQKTHNFAMFGTGRKNLLTPLAFEGKQMKAVKVDVVEYVYKKNQITNEERHSVESFPPDAIAVVGAACRLPGSNNLEELWELLRDAVIRCAEVPKERLDVTQVSRNSQHDIKWYGNFLDDVDAFDNEFFGVGPREAMYMDPQQRLLLETAYEALDASGYLRHHHREDFDKIGCFIGSTYTEYLENTTAVSPTAYTATGTIRAFQSGKISYHFGWSGPSEVVDTACSSSLVAIHRACRAIQAGECPMALAGGCNIITGMHNFLDLGTSRFLSRTGQCKPFDARGDGYCRADGIGLVVLKSLRQAVSQGDHILGVIPGIATNHGGLSSSITVPYPRAQTELFRTVLERAGMSSNQISYIEAHGTGTQVGDPIEMASIREVFGGEERQKINPLHIGSLKANVGHSETAAGVGSLLKVLSMMQQSQIPPLAGFQSLNPKIPALEPDNIVIPNQVVPWTVPAKAALVNSYGAAGSNAALVCCEAPVAANNRDRIANISWPILLSAAKDESLQAYAAKLAFYLRSNPRACIGDLSYTLSERRKHHGTRWISTEQDIASLIQSLESGLKDTFQVSNSAAKPVILVLSGQSKQFIGLEPSWYRAFSRLRSHLARCNSILTGLGYPSILSALFQRKPIEDVVMLQCGTFAVQYSCAQCWIDAGLEVQAVVGHSFGELTAMAVAGVLSLEDALKLVAARASLMQTKWGPERGTMLAVHTTRENVADLVALLPGLEIACFNSASSQVIVGSKSLIEQAELLLNKNERFTSIKVRHQRVDVTHGFHSVFTETILEDLEQVGNTLKFETPNIALATCTEHPLETITSDHLRRHTRMPVYFADTITRLEERFGSCIWLEAGADSPIIPMTKKAVQDASKHVFISGSAKDNTNAVSIATTMLWQEGHSVSFWPHLTPEESGVRSMWLPPYQFARTRHWLKYSDYLQKPGPRQDVNVIPNQPQRLVTAKGRSSESWASILFTVHQATSRYKDIVSGHAVRGQPLCPASMYMECAVMAAQMMYTTESGFFGSALKFDNLSFKGALGINHDRDVDLSMDGAGEYLSWNFGVRSAAKDRGARLTTHCTGRFAIASKADWGLYGRMITDRVHSLKSDSRAERLRADRAYTLFSRVVQYSSVLRGIDVIYIHENQAVAEIKRPQGQVSTEESTAVQVCDAVSLDTFIQVVGLLINSSAGCPVDEVYIATNIESITMQDCNFSKGDSWTAYATARVSSATQVMGDLFVLDAEGNLMLTASGVQFTRLPISKLEKVIEHAGINSATAEIRPTRQVEVGHETNIKEHIDPTPSPVSDDLGGQTLVTKALSSYSLKAPTVLESSVLRQMGLDSLSGVQLMKRIASELKTKEAGEIDMVGAAKSPDPPINVQQVPENHDVPDRMRIRQRVLELILENSGGSMSNIDDRAGLQDIGIDSLSIIELKSSLEDSFGMKLGHNELALESTVQDILDCVQRNSAAAKPSVDFAVSSFEMATSLHGRGNSMLAIQA